MYHQDTDYAFLLGALMRLDNRLVVDVGAERGSFVQACLEAGSPHVHAIEPYPPHAEALAVRFAEEPRVTTLACAIGARNEDATLHIAHDREGQAYDYHHSLVPSADSEEVRWSGAVTVPCRTLQALIDEGRIPAEVGILKVDTEGGDLGVLQGMGSLQAAVVMVEYWEGLPASIGDSPYRIADLIAELGPRGYREFVFIKRHDEFEVLQWNAAHTRAGDWGNLIFVHERALARLGPLFAERGAEVHERLVDRALDFRRAADERLSGLNAAQARADALDAECVRRLEVITALQARIGTLESEAKQGAEAPASALTAVPAAPDEVMPWIGPAREGEAERLRSGRPRVSIVTPSFNHARFLDETIRSVLDQGYPDLEYIVIDGGSTDGSVAIIDGYADRLAYWESAPDGGQTDALNKGFARATGDVVAWVNSDDLLRPGAIDAAVAAFAEDPSRGLVYGRGHRIDEHGGLISEFEETRPFDLHALAHGVDYILQPTTFMRHQALHEVGPLNRDMHFAFDWDLWLRLGKAYPAVMLDRVLAASREYAATKTSSGGFRRTEEIRRLVVQHTGRTISIGYLSYLMHAIMDALPAAGLPEPARLHRAVAGVAGVCMELLREERFIERGPQRRPLAADVGAHLDGWAGPELRWQMTVPAAARYLCLRGEHDAGIARLSGPLSLHAALDGVSLGLGVVDAPGAFALCWRLPAGEGRDVRRRIDVGSATSFVPSRYHDSTDHRALAFRFTSCTVERERPADAVAAEEQLQDVLAQVRRQRPAAQPLAAVAAAPSAGAPGASTVRRILGGVRRRARRWLGLATR